MALTLKYFAAVQPISYLISRDKNGPSTSAACCKSTLRPGKFCQTTPGLAAGDNVKARSLRTIPARPQTSQR